MANADDETPPFTGFRYLMDAKTSRQYALKFVNGSPELPIYFFNGDKLKPGETVYAVDDESQPSEKNLITKEVYKITATTLDEKGQHYDMPVTTVTYRMTASQNVSGIMRNTFVMTPESQKELADLKAQPDPDERIDLTDFPPRFEAPLSITTIPPQHKDGKATAARIGIRDLIATGKISPRPANDFPVVAPKKPRVPKGPPKIPDIKIEEALKKFGLDLNEEAKGGRLDPVIGRDDEIDQALMVLSRRKMSSLCFTGEPGCGKSAMFSGIAQCLASGKTMANGKPLPESLKGARVVLLDLQSMNAGSRYRGDFEEKFKPLIEGLAERNGVFKGQKIILAIDELHSQLTAGAAEGGTNAGEMMKPFLVTEGCSTMGACTDEEYRKFIEKNGALASRFEQKPISSPNEEATLAILKKLWPLVRDHNNLVEDLSEEGQKNFNDQLKYIVTMTNRYKPAESQPRKSEKALNMAGSSAEFDGRTFIEHSDIINAVAQMSKLSPEFLSQSDSERFLKMETELPKEVVGQPGLSNITDGLIGARSGLTNPKQPWGSFVLQGPTGTGKTETCKALARYLFGDEDAMIKVDMGDYAEKHNVSRLIGAPPGYIGSDEPSLLEQVRQKPYCILLLDEIEKAHTDVFNVLLPILNDGKTKDNHGNTILFNNVIVVMTTNLGAADVQNLLDGKAGGMGLDRGVMSPEKKQQALEKIYKDSRSKFFKPEMINRINALGGFITFVPLEPKVIEQLAEREIAKVSSYLGKTDGANVPGVTLEVSESVMQQLCKEGYNPAMGARPLQTVIREKIVNPLGKWLMGNKDEVKAFVAKEGPSKLVITSLDMTENGRPVVTPVLTKVTPVVVNDNTPVKRAPARKKAAGAAPK